jgi:hypothetical protein
VRPARLWIGLAALSTACVVVLGATLGTALADPPELYRRHVLDGQLIIDLPARWPTLRPADARFPGTKETLTLRRPDLAPLLLGLSYPDFGMYLLAFDPASKGDVTANVTVRLGQAPAAPFRRWTRATVVGIRSASGRVGSVAVSRVRVPGGRALRVDYERTPLGARSRVALTQVSLSTGRALATISFAMGHGQRARYEPTIRRVLQTLDVLR